MNDGPTTPVRTKKKCSRALVRDFRVVIERDLFREPPHRIHAIPVNLTMRAGHIVFACDGPGFKARGP